MNWMLILAAIVAIGGLQLWLSYKVMHILDWFNEQLTYSLMRNKLLVRNIMDVVEKHHESLDKKVAEDLYAAMRESFNADKSSVH